MRILNDRFHPDRNVVRVPGATDGPARSRSASRTRAAFQSGPSLALLCFFSVSHTLSIIFLFVSGLWNSSDPCDRDDWLLDEPQSGEFMDLLCINHALLAFGSKYRSWIVQKSQSCGFLIVNPQINRCRLTKHCGNIALKCFWNVTMLHSEMLQLTFSLKW